MEVGVLALKGKATSRKYHGRQPRHLLWVLGPTGHCSVFRQRFTGGYCGKVNVSRSIVTRNDIESVPPELRKERFKGVLNVVLSGVSPEKR